MSDRCSNLLDFQWHQYVSWRSFAYSNITICHCTPSKPHSTSMISLVVLTRTCLNMLNMRIPQCEHSLQRLQNLPRTGQGMLFHGFQWFSMVFHGFPHDGIAVPLGPLWFLPHPLRVLLPRKMFLVQRSKHCRPHCRHLWIVVACNTSNMNQQRKRMVLMVIHGNVVLGCPPTFSTLRCVKLFVRGLCKPVPMTPTIMQVFWYLQGSLQDSFFANVFRRFSVRCSIFLISNWISMCCEAPFRLAASLYGHYVLCKPHSTSMEAQ